MKKEETARQTSIQEKNQKHWEIRFMMHLRMRERSQHRLNKK